MSISPWPVEHNAGVLFILDASHAVEEELLASWLDYTRGERAESDVQRLVLPIGRSPERIPAAALAELELSADTLVVPLRVVWLSSVDSKSTTPRFRDLLLGGNPRRPGTRRARRILRGDPGRAHRIAADSATVGEMQERLSQRLGRAPEAVEFADFVAGQAGLALDIAERRLQGGRYKVPRQVYVVS